MTLGAKARPSGIPTSGKPSVIPNTPGRIRSSSAASHRSSTVTEDDETMSTAFADAIRANDPALHRSFGSTALGRPSYQTDADSRPVRSGRKSVAGRPSSVASSSSALGLSRSARPFTPSTRSASRQSERRSSSRIDGAFDIGDCVRIESLGFEGVLRFLGEIDGKAGQWAGVELSGGFAGKGKNDGSVSGKHYFVCAPKCGVFVSATKLSPPTVGALSPESRPSSVASFHGGRIIDSSSNHIAPSISTGRVTPYGRASTTSARSGKVTPSSSSSRSVSASATASIPARYSNTSISTPKLPKAEALSHSPYAFSPGSSASRYAGMTAQQLTARMNESSGSVGPPIPQSPRTRVPSSPYAGSTYSSNTPTSSAKTPKAGLAYRAPAHNFSTTSLTPTKPRPSSSGTPRARIPSSVAMPPPPSLITRSISTSLDDQQYASTSEDGNVDISDLITNGQSLRDRIAQLASGKVSSSSSPRTKPPSSPIFASTNHFPQIDTPDPTLSSLRLELESLQSDNSRLRSAVENLEMRQANDMQVTDTLRTERDDALARISMLETSLKTSERSSKEQAVKIESLERNLVNITADMDKARTDGESRIRDMQSRLEDKDTLLQNLKEAVEKKEGLENETDAILKAKNAEIALLEARVNKAYAELDAERKQLGSQVDELRQAGQETIALYEERLSAAESKRYEQEDMIASLREQLRSQDRPLSPSSAVRIASSAAQIENETLRDQVSHLQDKVATLEDTLEENRVNADREDALLREKLKRAKEKEDAVRQQVVDNEKEMERVAKSESTARGRVEELEEALRESAVALENAQAEIEGLRFEIANLESLASNASGSPAGQITEMARQASADRARYTQELAQLRNELDQLKSEKASISQKLDGRDPSINMLVDIDKDESIRLNEELRQELVTERNISIELRKELNRLSQEAESARRKVSREFLAQDELPDTKSASPSTRNSAAIREELAGLKHIIQELQKENVATAQLNRVLESENKLLLTETEQLREEMKTLEDNVEKSLLRQEHELEQEALSSDDNASLSRAMKEMKAKHEMDMEQLRKRQAENEMKSARTIHDLNKEVSELESLVESKIYREDELEQELERLKEKLSRNQRKSSKNVSETVDDAVVCEICEQKGHDIFGCDVLKGEATSSRPVSVMSGQSSEKELYCEDCGERGHSVTECPHSMDVF